MTDEQTLTVQIDSYTFFNDTDGDDYIDFNDPVVRQNLQKLAVLIQEVENRTGHKFDNDIIISGKYGYKMAPGAEGDAGRLHVGTYGWAEGNLGLTEGLLYHEMGHHASKNVLYIQTIAVNVSANNILDSMEHFVRTDPQRAQGWMIETFGSIKNAWAFVARIQPLIDSNIQAIQPILGKTDVELFEALKANPALLKDIAGALDTETSTRLMTDEDLNLMGRMMDLHMQDKVLRAHNFTLMDIVGNEASVQEIINGHPLRDFQYHTPDIKFAELAEMLAPYRDNATPVGHALIAAQRAEEYMADRYAFRHVSNLEAYMRSLKDLEHAEGEMRNALGQVQAATGFDGATHPTIEHRRERGREYIASVSRKLVPLSPDHLPDLPHIKKIPGGGVAGVLINSAIGAGVAVATTALSGDATASTITDAAAHGAISSAVPYGDAAMQAAAGNDDEAAISAQVETWGYVGCAAGTYVGATGGGLTGVLGGPAAPATVPAGAVAGGAVGCGIGGMATGLVADEVLRGVARYWDGNPNVQPGMVGGLAEAAWASAKDFGSQLSQMCVFDCDTKTSESTNVVAAKPQTTRER